MKKTQGFCLFQTLSSQMEEKLTEAYETGFLDGQASGQNWKQAVKEALEETKGIGPGRKELFLERLDRKMERPQDPEKTQ